LSGTLSRHEIEKDFKITKPLIFRLKKIITDYLYQPLARFQPTNFLFELGGHTNKFFIA